MITNTRAPLFSPSRRSLMKLAGAGAVGAATALSACSETATAATPANDAIDPNAMAILSANENPYGPSPMAVEAIKAEAGNLYRYTYPTVMKFAEMVAEREGVAPEQVLVTNGSTPILAAFPTG
jgi:histidinol-phosphate aminotransferase